MNIKAIIVYYGGAILILIFAVGLFSGFFNEKIQGIKTNKSQNASNKVANETVTDETVKPPQIIAQTENIENKNNILQDSQKTSTPAPSPTPTPTPAPVPTPAPAPTQIAFHFECKDMACVVVIGPGNNECSTGWGECYHYECSAKACVQVSGKGEDSCKTKYDCTHKECIGGKCSEVLGKGDSKCYSDYSCVHKVCDGGKCIQINEPGTSQCYSDYTCEQAVPVTYTEWDITSLNIVMHCPSADDLLVSSYINSINTSYQDYNSCLAGMEEGQFSCKMDCEENYRNCRQSAAVIAGGRGSAYDGMIEQCEKNYGESCLSSCNDIYIATCEYNYTNLVSQKITSLESLGCY